MNEQVGQVLVVDDNRVTRRELESVLGEQGHNVLLAVGGQQALAMLSSESVDVVLLDIMMPDIDGFAVLEEMARNGMLAQIPVIVISAMDEMDSVIRSVQMGAEDYLSKPFNHVLLNARVGASLEKKRLRDQEREYVRQLQLEQERLREYTLELQTSNEELDAFAHTVAHDLKTPLGVVIGCSELLLAQLNDSLGEKEAEYLDAIVQSSSKMSDITDALLMLASVRQMAPADITTLDMGGLVKEARERLAHLEEERRAEIITPSSWPQAVGYGPWVEEIWANYIGNAIIYGGQPPIVTLGADLMEGDVVRFWVQDNGDGLSEAEQERLFSPFTRLSKSNVKGHGLGLSITRRIVEKLGGSVRVESQSGQGSRFSFTLPTSTGGRGEGE